MCWCTISSVDALNEGDPKMASELFFARDSEEESLEPSLIETAVTVSLTAVQVLFVSFLWMAMARVADLTWLF
jgi:hypothetical protein